MQHNTRSPSHCNKARKRNSHTDWKCKIRFIVFANDTKYLGANLTKALQDFHVENYKGLMEEIKECLNNKET